MHQLLWGVLTNVIDSIVCIARLMSNSLAFFALFKMILP